MNQTKTHTGGCHCKKIRFEVSTDLAHVFLCNCSICAKMGSLVTFVPKDHFTLLLGEDALVDYQFGKKRVHHPFCRHCGIHAFGRGTGPDGSEMRSVNVRCLDDVDVNALTVKPYDGKSL
jgi:hypothetical protein